MSERPITYFERLRIGWLIAWRLSVVLLVLGVAFGFLLGIAGAVLGLDRQTVTAVALAGTVPLLIFAGYPLVVRMMLRKRFAGFRVRLVRDGEPVPASPAEPFGGDSDRAR